MVETLTYLGIACIIAAIVGGGSRVLGYEIPVIGSILRQIILAIFGVMLIGSVQNEAFHSYLSGLFPSSYNFKEVAVAPGTWERQSIVAGKGMIRVKIISVSPGRNPVGLPYEPRVYICPPSNNDITKCPWKQLPVGGIHEQQVVEPGTYTIAIFNYGVNPPLNVTAEVTYPW